jgi:DNA repair protein RecO (recombination protein O)
MLKRTEAIVLRTVVFGEADLIVTYITRDYGLLKAFAKSPRKTKSRFGSSLEPLTYSKIALLGKEDASLPRLTQSDIVRPFHALREDFKCFLNLSEIIELSLRFLQERAHDADVFNLFLGILSLVETGKRSDVYMLYYKIRFLSIMGYEPHLNACCKCGRKLEYRGLNKNAKWDFYASHGALVCVSCLPDPVGAKKISDGALKFYRSLIGWPMPHVGRIQPPLYLTEELNAVIDAHISYILGGCKTSISESFQSASVASVLT